jgi:hypothetical protein
MDFNQERTLITYLRRFVSSAHAFTITLELFLHFTFPFIFVIRVLERTRNYPRNSGKNSQLRSKIKENFATGPMTMQVHGVETSARVPMNQWITLEFHTGTYQRMGFGSINCVKGLPACG